MRIMVISASGDLVPGVECEQLDRLIHAAEQKSTRSLLDYILSPRSDFPAWECACQVVSARLKNAAADAVVYNGWVIKRHGLTVDIVSYVGQREETA